MQDAKIFAKVLVFICIAKHLYVNFKLLTSKETIKTEAFKERLYLYNNSHKAAFTVCPKFGHTVNSVRAMSAQGLGTHCPYHMGNTRQLILTWYP